MAALTELRNLRSDVTMLQKVEGAVLIAADTIYNESAATTNHANRIIWAKQAMERPSGKTQAVWNAMLAANNTATVATILALFDSTIQTAVDTSIDLFADGS